MEFLPETQRALDEYLSLSDPDLSESLTTMSDRATTIVSTLVGLSLCLIDDGLTFTAVASSLRLAELDAMQYLQGGPCVAAVEDLVVRNERMDDLLDEERWLLFARASAASGIASTLSLPVVADGRVVCGINLYASTPEAFTGHHEELGHALGALAAGAVTNADLGFDSRRRAAEAPGILRDQQLTDVAVGILAAGEDGDLGVGMARLTDAAARAGITVAQAAQMLIVAQNPPPD